MTTPNDLESLGASFLGLGGNDIKTDFALFERQFRTILSYPPRDVRNSSWVLRCVQHAQAYANWSWDPRMVALQAVCGDALKAWADEQVLYLELITALFDLTYFLAWCFNSSNLDQARDILPTMRLYANRVGAPSVARRMSSKHSMITVAYLTRTADPSSAVTACSKHVIDALRTKPERYRPLLYVWDHLDPAMESWVGKLAAPLAFLKRNTPLLTAEAILAQSISDSVDVVISDINNAVPTLLYSRRLAPVQAFLQVGLPAWGTINLDCVFNGFGFDPAWAGWGNADVYPFTPPWDLDALKGPEDPEGVASEREGLPLELRIIGCYCRLVKINADFLLAAERILLARSDVCLLLGGTGNAAHIESFVCMSPVGNRIFLRPGFVPGQRWARLLHVFLDTWPFQGGGSIREVTVHGVPVVSMHSPEMPSMDVEKDPELIAQNWEAFVGLVVSLLVREDLYRRASERALLIAHRMADKRRFQAAFLQELEGTIKRIEALS